MSAAIRTTSPQVHLPRQGPILPKPRPEQVLFVCHYEPTGVSTITETAAFLQTFSKFPITVLNMYEHRYSIGPIMFPPNVDLDRYAAIIFHSTVTYNSENIYAIDRHTERKLKDFAGVKVLMKQDDNHKFRHLRPYIGEAGFDLVLTCLPPEAVPIVYPPHDVGHARFERMLTGYVTPTLRAIADPALPRPIDIGYRGSVMPLWFGRLCYDKHRIGTDVAQRLARRDVALDISSRTEDRLGSEAWFDFLLSCKATLGTESGASIFDLDGDLHGRVAAIEGEIGPFQEGEAYAEAYLSRLADLENVIDYGQVSPRHFEAAACRTLQILFPGTYSGILRPHDHYVPLAHDCSNLDEVVDLTRDEVRRNAITNRAYEEIINNRRYWIETFIARLDDLVLECAEAKGGLRKERAPGRTAARHVLALTTAGSPGDTRWAWLRANAPDDLRLHRISVDAGEASGGGAREVGASPLDWRLPASPWIAGDAFDWATRFGDSPAVAAVTRELCFIEGLLGRDEADFVRAFLAPPHSPRLPLWRAHLGSLLAVTKTLVEAAQDLRGIHAIVAGELRCLPAAILMSRALGAPLVYDAARCEPEADPRFQEFERQFLSDLEGRLLREADHKVAASPELAGWLRERHGLAFEAIRSAPPRLPSPARTASGAPRTVLLVASDAAEGLHRAVIEAWPDVPSGARLRVFRSGRTRATDGADGPAPVRVEFVDGTADAMLAELIAAADVVVVAADPAFTDDRVTVPAAIPLCLQWGVPIIAHPTPALESALAGSGGAALVNLRDRGRLVRLIEAFVADPPRSGAPEARSEASSDRRRGGELYGDRLCAWVSHAPPGMLRVFEPASLRPARSEPRPASEDTPPTPDPAPAQVLTPASEPAIEPRQETVKEPARRWARTVRGVVRRLTTRARRRGSP